MLLQGRIEYGVNFRAVTTETKIQGGIIPPHWESEGGRVIMVIPPNNSNSSWQVFSLPDLDRNLDGFSTQISGGQSAEDAAFLVATRGLVNTS